MSVFDAVDFDSHEEVAFFTDRKSGLKAIIAIHSTALGPACGGTRMFPYPDGKAAMIDALRLSRGMSYKNAMASLPLGGGKAVILGDPSTDKTESRLLTYGNCVNAMGGRYITAMDVGIVPADMPVIARATKHIAGYDQPGKPGGDSGPATALGVYAGMKAAIRHRLKTDTAKGVTVAIQGLGKVGMGLAERLHEDGAKLIVADINADAVRLAADKFGAAVSTPDAIVKAPCDVFSPNALGAVLNDRTIPALRARVVAGAANNQLERDRHGEMLRDRGVLYAPDYVINGGGVIRVCGQIFSWSEGEIERRVYAIAHTLEEIFRRSESDGVPTNVIADRIAEERIAASAARAPGKAAE